MAGSWRAAGLNYLQYTQITSQALRNVLKGEAKAASARRENVVLKYAKWENGKQTQAQPVKTQ